MKRSREFYVEVFRPDPRTIDYRVMTSAEYHDLATKLDCIGLFRVEACRTKKQAAALVMEYALGNRAVSVYPVFGDKIGGFSDWTPEHYIMDGTAIFVYRNMDGWLYISSDCDHPQSGFPSREKAMRAAQLHYAQIQFDGQSDNCASIENEQDRREHADWISWQRHYSRLKSENPGLDTHELHQMTCETYR